jgi:hypothetical protein
MRLKRQLAALALACAASAAAPGARAQDAPAPQEPPREAGRDAPPSEVTPPKNTPAAVTPPAINLRVVPATPAAPWFGGRIAPRAQAQPTPVPPPNTPGPSNSDPERDRLRLLYEAQRASRTVKGSYLGVSTSPVPAALRQHLNLPEGVGLVCDFVEKGSPAEGAGLKQYDVLHKLDDQILVNAQQLAVLIRARKGGQEVKLSIIRGGKPETVGAKLVEKDVRPLPESFFGAFDPNHPEAGIEFTRPPDVAFNDVFEQANRSVDVRKSDDRTVVTFNDGEHTLTVTRRGEGKRHLTAKDRRGKVVFDGPIDSKEERANLPGEIAEKLKQLDVVRVPGETRPRWPDAADKPENRDEPREEDGADRPRNEGDSRDPESNASLIRPDDLVEIRVNDLEGPGVETVKLSRVRKGEVALPHVGPVKAEGLTPDQLELKVVEAYRNADLIEQATVQVRKVGNVRDARRDAPPKQ